MNIVYVFFSFVLVICKFELLLEEILNYVGVSVYVIFVFVIEVAVKDLSV